MNVFNGIALRADVHILFDSGRLTVVERDGHLYWRVDPEVKYLTDVHGQCCDHIFKHVNRLSFLLQTQRLHREESLSSVFLLNKI
jgi:hypothetical protein